MFRKIFLPCLLISARGLLAAEADLQKVEDILERLEKKIMEQEGLSASYGQPPLQQERDKSSVVQKRPEQIKADIKENVKLKEIASAISEIELELDKLESDVQKTKQKIFEDSSLSSSLELVLVPPAADRLALRHLKVSLDGVSIYELSQPSGIWAPRRSIPLFNGPIYPGVHKFEVEMNVVERNSRGLPINQDAFRSLRKDFSINVSSRTAQLRYEVVIAEKNNRMMLEMRQKAVTPLISAKSSLSEVRNETKNRDSESRNNHD